MATTYSTSLIGKQSSSTTIIPAGKRLRTETLTAPVLLISTQLLSTILERKRLEISPPLPIICKPFGFLKSLNFRSVGLELEDVSYEFGWELVLFESVVVQGPCEAQFEVVEVEDESSLSKGDLDELHVTEEKSVLAGTGSEPGLESSGFLYELETRAEPSSEPFECQPKPFPIYEEQMDESEKVVDVDVSEESGSPIEILQTKTIQVQPSGQG